VAPDASALPRDSCRGGGPSRVRRAPPASSRVGCRNQPEDRVERASARRRRPELPLAVARRRPNLGDPPQSVSAVARSCGSYCQRAVSTSRVGRMSRTARSRTASEGALCDNGLRAQLAESRRGELRGVSRTRIPFRRVPPDRRLSPEWFRPARPLPPRGERHTRRRPDVECRPIQRAGYGAAAGLVDRLRPRGCCASRSGDIGWRGHAGRNRGRRSHLARRSPLGLTESGSSISSRPLERLSCSAWHQHGSLA
jgi:hypothetical protein